MCKKSLKCLLWTSLPILLAVGCAHNQPRAGAVYGAHSDEVLTATSARAEQRVYSAEAMPGAPAAEHAAPQGVNIEEWALAEEIREMFMADRTLAAGSRDISAEIVKGSPGTVVLQGTVRNTHERRRVEDRISSLPGVTQVDNQIVVGTLRGGNWIDTTRP
jgi:hypothetical protein